MMTAVFAGNTTIFMRKWDTIQAFEIIQRALRIGIGALAFAARRRVQRG